MQLIKTRCNVSLHKISTKISYKFLRSLQLIKINIASWSTPEIFQFPPHSAATAAVNYFLLITLHRVKMKLKFYTFLLMAFISIQNKTSPHLRTDTQKAWNKSTTIRFRFFLLIFFIYYCESRTTELSLSSFSLWIMRLCMPLHGMCVWIFLRVGFASFRCQCLFWTTFEKRDSVTQ